MNLRSIRLASLGCFGAPVQIDGLGDGLNVLAGPNEAGKSTILRALKALFTYPDQSKHRDVSGLEPYGGGSPHVEVVFDVDGGSWRYGKTFRGAGGGRASTSLEEIGGKGRSFARREAHDRARALMGEAEGWMHWLPLLWVGQTEALEAFVPDAEARQPLMQLIGREVQSVGGGGAARRLRQTMQAKLDAEVTTRGAKARSRYWEAVSSRDQLHADVAEAEARAEATGERFAELAARSGERAALDNPVVRHERETAITIAAEAIARARAASVELRTADAELAAAAAAETAARKMLGEHDERLSRLALLGESSGALETERGKLASAADAAARSMGTTEENLVAARKERDARAGELERARREARRGELGEALDRLTSRHASATEIAAELALAESAIDEAAATPERMEAIERELREMERLQDRMEHGAPQITFALDKMGEGRVRIDGDAVARGEVRRALEPVVIEIEGVGRITVAPGTVDGAGDGAGDGADLAGDLVAHRAQFDALLGSLGASSVEQARAEAVALHETRARSSALRAQLAGLLSGLPDDGTPGSVPEPVAALRALEARIDALGTEAGGLASEDDPGAGAMREPDIVAGEHARAVGQVRDAEARWQAASRAALEARDALGATDARCKAHSLQMAELSAALPGESERDGLRTGLAEQAASALQSVQAFTSARDGIGEKILDAKAVRALEAAHEQALAEEDAVRQRLRVLGGEIGRLEGALVQDAEAATQGTVVDLRGALADAERRVAACESEQAAQRVLVEALDHAAQSVRTQFEAPVVARMQPYLNVVLPDASFAMGDDLGVAELHRRGAGEDLVRLSRGTQEQIAVLVRLGFARLFAEQGHPMPVILDDAMVYSDDTRIARMFQALQLAATHHQVIVLTCRTETFAALGGNRVEIAPRTVG